MDGWPEPRERLYQDTIDHPSTQPGRYRMPAPIGLPMSGHNRRIDWCWPTERGASPRVGQAHRRGARAGTSVGTDKPTPEYGANALIQDIIGIESRVFAVLAIRQW